MTIARDIIYGQHPNFDAYLRKGESLDDIDEYGYTPLIESVMMQRPSITKDLIARGVNINKPDVAGRTALHWAVDNNDLSLAELLLKHKANPNAYTLYGFPVLVYPLLRKHTPIKHLLYAHKAQLDFALDYIDAKLLGHRFELTGDVDIVTAEGRFIELDFEGFILEFTIDIVRDSLRRFINHYASRHLRPHFPYLSAIVDGFEVASRLLQLQLHPMLTADDKTQLTHLIKAPLLILPAASKGHALCFIRYGQWWAKIDRGENSLKEGSANIYQISYPEKLNLAFVEQFLYKRQSRDYFHKKINQQLGLIPVLRVPIRSQITGNCSWANVQAIVPVAYIMQQLAITGLNSVDMKAALRLYHAWVMWDQDRALYECIHRFHRVDLQRKASLAAILATVLFQACNYAVEHHVERAEKILKILTLPGYEYILASYLDIYCVRRLTPKGNNLLKLLEACGINPHIGVMPVASDLKQIDDDNSHQDQD